MDPKSFLHRLLHAFDAPEPAPLPEPDEKLALGTLLVRVAKSDLEYAFAEISQIDKLLTRLFGLGPIEAAKMRATCERLDKEAPDTEKFAQIIRQMVSFDARLDALEALWEVVLVDGAIQSQEIDVISQVQTVLGLSEEDSIEAKAKAMQQMG
ncbi:TerB family tellurite resistance protein [Roseovarius rhodophyticola]|uniref:TerB family tellurite resistance protein n=1 Tax=Roseovarius rhodophyticola TaxID=3080827 RepID=A0ABZ2TD73_9RHOB|nr:TerB family tellurite resistance protein [Roseovarius sp. W115]MDV2931343.1 TerB family tellurite resistance protein [Roseovarius sp. W115]